MPDCVSKEIQQETKSVQLESDLTSVSLVSQASKSIDIPKANAANTSGSNKSPKTDIITPLGSSTKNESAGPVDHDYFVSSPGKTSQTPSSPQSPGVHFEPLVHLELIDVKTMEENEVELFKMRGKLYRYDTSGDEPEWKERGTGDVKILQRKTDSSCIRFIMRQEKTLKIRANHYIDPAMTLEHHGSSDRAFVWVAGADYSEGICEPETFAVKFKNVEDAQRFSDVFQSAQKTVNEARDQKPTLPMPSNEGGDKNKDVEDATVGESESRPEGVSVSDDISSKLEQLSVAASDEPHAGTETK